MSIQHYQKIHGSKKDGMSKSPYPTKNFSEFKPAVHLLKIDLTSITIDIHRLENYIQKHEGGLITATRHETENIINNRMTITRKQ